jgi:hypothetical protein
MKTVSCVFVTTAVLLGCTPTVPHRTQLSPISTDHKCASAASKANDASSNASNHERVGEADLYFVEFDDQGLLFPQEGAEYGAASCQTDALMADLDFLAKSESGLSIIVYVHGWKHNAAAADSDVQTFRQLLVDAAAVEAAKEQFGQQHGLKRNHVVGVYVSWRGKSLDLPEPLISLTFWDRKNTAQHVAQGQSRDLFARLRGFQTTQNRDSKPDAPQKKVLLILMGHSFGGLILFNAVSQSLINSLYEDGGLTPAGRKITPRFADMIIVANPAVEALRYTPLHRAAAAGTFDQYQTPIFVSVTSRADWATGRAFPFGRYLNTIFQTHASEEEEKANRNTMGHVDQYITHELELRAKDAPDVCREWKTGTTLADLKLEVENSRRFFEQLGARALDPGWTREFCGNTRLRHRMGVSHPYSPIWNVRTNKEIVPGHNDITKPHFIGFVRQLYHDVVINRLIIVQESEKPEAKSRTTRR